MGLYCIQGWEVMVLCVHVHIRMGNDGDYDDG